MSSEQDSSEALSTADAPGLPPTVIPSLNSLHTKTFYSPIPSSVLQSDSPVILGVDEAGRGPVMGPMVYGISYCTLQYQDEVLKRKYGFDDSKKLTDGVRRDLFKRIYTGEIDQVGYATTSITPCDISSGMLRYPPEKNYNLNEQAHDVTMALIRGVLDRNVNLEHVYVDTVGPPATYQRKLELQFPNVKFTVAKKADSLYCVVSVASVVAKVTRDVLIDHLKTRPDEILGSGYPSDSKTTTWLRNNMTPLFGWPAHAVRFSWQTCQTLLDKNNDTVPLEWEESFISKKHQPASTLFLPTQKLVTLDNWYSTD
ncbi:LAFE_0E12376g1_1 [Lachancea fermentati]|uniref:Ribonuclease n=1 Tax=Lachancea fermentati TaxID=4955 RepID=A0A1G4MDR0_LACFM|nr:LAFE_0E12376g1_1 [Lachancea fermentati]